MAFLHDTGTGWNITNNYQLVNNTVISGTSTANQAQIQRRIPSPPLKPKIEYGPDEWVMNFNIGTQVGACGVGNMYSFYKLNLNTLNIRDCPYYKNQFSKESIHVRSGGCGFLSVAFIDTEDCKMMFQKLKEWFPILYQSDIRYNKNSENNFFFCIFDTGEKEKNDEDPEEGDGFANGLDW